MSWIQTLDGGYFDYLEMKSSSIDPNTIARVLARTCRFKGHSQPIYTTAQHSLHVESLCGGDVSLRLGALLHDAHEVYDGFGDVATPAKNLNNFVKQYLKALAAAVNVPIAWRFGINPAIFEDARIKYADEVAVVTEKRDVMGPCDREWERDLPPPDPTPIVVMSIEEAEAAFLKRLNELYDQRLLEIGF